MGAQVHRPYFNKIRGIKNVNICYVKWLVQGSTKYDASYFVEIINILQIQQGVYKQNFYQISQFTIHHKCFHLKYLYFVHVYFL